MEWLNKNTSKSRALNYISSTVGFDFVKYTAHHIPTTYVPYLALETQDGIFHNSKSAFLGSKKSPTV